jgi:hypothetical protein
MLKWAGIVFGCGMLLLAFEYSIASKKKGGITWTDKRRMMGIFWVTCGLAALAASLVYMA